jgi:hypothetical protein
MSKPPFAVVETSSAQRNLMQRPCLAHRIGLWVDVLEALLEMSQQLMPEPVPAGRWVVVNPPARLCRRLGDGLEMKIRSEVY